MIRAVFFDWGNTLVAWEFDPELFVEGHVRGLAAFGAGAPSQPDFTDAYSRQLLPLLVGEREDEVDYTAEVAALFGSLGAAGDADAVSRFVMAENRVWRPTHHLEPAVVEVIDTLRADGLEVGLISNAFDPPALMRELFAEIGLLERLDAIALSAEVGKRKPHALMFESALAQAGVEPGEARDGRRPSARGRRGCPGARDRDRPGALVRGRRFGSCGARCGRRHACGRVAMARPNLKTGRLSSLAESGRLLSRSRR